MKNRTFIVFFLSLITVISSLPSLYAQGHPLAKLPSSTAIEVEMIKPAEVSVPAEFQIALYENLIQELEKKASFARSIVKATEISPAIPTLSLFTQRSPVSKRVARWLVRLRP